MWNRWEVDRIERGWVELDVDCFVVLPSSQLRGLGRIQSGGIIVMLPAVVFACAWRFLVAPLVRSLVIGLALTPIISSIDQ